MICLPNGQLPSRSSPDITSPECDACPAGEFQEWEPAAKPECKIKIIALLWKVVRALCQKPGQRPSAVPPNHIVNTGLGNLLGLG